MENMQLVPAQVKKEVLTAQQAANELVVTTPDQAEHGSGVLRTIKEYRKALTERKEEMTRPLMKSLASIRDLFKPYELDLNAAEKSVKAKLLSYQIEQEEVLERARLKIVAKVEKGRMRPDTAADKLEAVGEVKKVKGLQTRTLTKVRVADETLVPREYLIPNMPMITNAVLHENASIPGVERYEEKSLASV